MNEEIKTEEKKLDSNAIGLSWLGIFVFFLGLVAINLVWFIFFPNLEEKYPALLAAALLSLLLGFFLAFQNWSTLKRARESQLEMEAYGEKMASAGKNSSQREKDLEKAK